MYNYVDPLNSNLICCICRMPFTDPYTTQACQHTFCRDCIIHSLNRHSSQCPIDRNSLSLTELVPADPIIRSLVDELIVECPHREEGCTHTTQRQLMATHLESGCSYQQAFIPSKAEAAQTQESDDNNISVTEDMGSVSRATQTEPDTVIRHSPDSRFSTIFEQNILLRHRAELLESTISIMRKDMATVRRALGPWFRAAEGTDLDSRGDPRSSPTMVSPSSSITGDEIAQDASVAEQASATQNVETLLWNPLEFPPPMSPGRPEEETPTGLDIYRLPYNYGVPTVRPPTDLLQHQRRYSVGAARVDTRPPQADTLVTPLNLNTSLEGTLAGLRESLVGLASSIDSMGRRHEMGLAHEGMRVNEEVGGLRAAIHGLRMQVHSIMMDRNAQVTGRPPVFNGAFSSSGPPGENANISLRSGSQVKL